MCVCAFFFCFIFFFFKLGEEFSSLSGGWIGLLVVYKNLVRLQWPCATS